MNDYKLIANERMRWGYMSVKQLLTRLSRITKEGKLECFLLLATEAKDQRLFNAAVMRAADLGYNINLKDIRLMSAWQTPKLKERYLEKSKATPKYVTPESIKPIKEKPEQKYFNLFDISELERAIEF